MKPSLLTRAAVGAAATAAVLLPLAGCSGNETGHRQSSSTSAPTSSISIPSPEGTGTSTASTEYADGTYTARGVYGGAPSYMDFTVTVSGGVITDVESELMPDNNDTSRGYQERFAAALPDEVAGKSLDDADIGVLAGASGCSDGFNAALADIREQAAEN